MWRRSWTASGSGHGRLDVLVNDVWGGDPFTTWGKTIWEHPLEATLTIVRNGVETHLITSHLALPLRAREQRGAGRGGRRRQARRALPPNVPYDLVKNTVVRLGEALAWELRPPRRDRAVVSHPASCARR